MVVLCAEVVKYVLDEWDPLNLLALGAPLDEYDYELDIILFRFSFLNEISSFEIAKIIHETFTYAFDESIFAYSIDDLIEHAELILEINRH